MFTKVWFTVLRKWCIDKQRVLAFLYDISSRFASSIVHLTSMRKETYETLFTVMSCPKALFELSLSVPWSRAPPGSHLC